MPFSILIPYREGDPVREMAVDFVVAWYEKHHPEWPVLVGGDDPAIPAWHKGAAVEALVLMSDTPGLIVADSDVFVSPAALDRSAGAVAAGAPWSMPHGQVYRLNRRATSLVYDGRINGDPRMVAAGALAKRAHEGPPGGGIVVLSRKAYDESGGIDERFTEWGGEDISWARALDTLVGPCIRFRAPMWHLYHEPMFRRPGNRASEENERIAAMYAEAEGKPSQMRALISA